MKTSIEKAISKSRKIKAEWTGKYPCLCSGEWIITVDGNKVDLPEDVRTGHMRTKGIYSSWSFGEDWSEDWSYYEEGLDFEPWVEKNAAWIAKLNLSAQETRDLYDAISECDWRHGSCGGCI